MDTLLTILKSICVHFAPGCSVVITVYTNACNCVTVCGINYLWSSTVESSGTPPLLHCPHSEGHMRDIYVPYSPFCKHGMMSLKYVIIRMP